MKAFLLGIVLGHSYGSICGNAIATNYPNDVDALINRAYSSLFVTGLVPLTVGIAISAFLAYNQLTTQPLYLAQSVQEGRRIGLYTNDGGYDPAIVAYDFDNEGTISLGEYTLSPFQSPLSFYLEPYSIYLNA